MVNVLVTLIFFQIKHFLCDFPMQNKYCLGKFKPFPHFIAPLAYHSLIHATGTWAVLMWLFPKMLLQFAVAFCAFDFVTHFIIDRLKASKRLLGRFKPEQPYFWWALGLDQLLHQLVYIAIIYYAGFVL